jgi:hypothetical protein
VPQKGAARLNAPDDWHKIASLLVRPLLKCMGVLFISARYQLISEREVRIAFRSGSAG